MSKSESRLLPLLPLLLVVFMPSAAAVAIAADESMLGVYKENLGENII